MDKIVRYLIIEDEALAYEELKRLVMKVRPFYECAGWASSVQQAVTLLRTNTYDLLFMDVQLSDGLSFDIFRIVPTRIPIIFTTAYDEYALKAFKANSVDYLLKPISEDELALALDKMDTHYLPPPATTTVQDIEKKYLLHGRRTRFLVTVGDDYRYVPTSDIRCFLSEDKYTYLYVRGGKYYIVSHSLDSIAQTLSPTDFCRISRNCISHIDAVARCRKYFGGRLSIHLTADCPQAPIVVSRGRVPQVLAWLDGEADIHE